MAPSLEWSHVSRSLQDEWEEPLHEPPRAWSEIEGDVRFGWEQSLSDEYKGAQWEDVESDIRQRWEYAFPDRDDDDWEIVGEEIRRAFDRGRSWGY